MLRVTQSAAKQALQQANHLAVHSCLSGMRWLDHVLTSPLLPLRTPLTGRTT